MEKRPSIFWVLAATAAVFFTFASSAAAQYFEHPGCFDNDGGINASVRARMTINDRPVWIDSCLNPSELQEGYCDERYPYKYKATVIECPQGCFEGVCYSEPAKTRPTRPTTATTATTTTTTTTQTTSTTATTSTIASEQTTTTALNAPTTTINATLEPVSVDTSETVIITPNMVCVASDGANSPYVKGNVTINGRVAWSDTCVNPSQLEKGRCDRFRRLHYRVEFVDCVNGCFEGACRR